VKFGGNYAPTVASIKKAAEEGCSQSLFVYDEDEWVTEAGTMNMFFLMNNAAGEKELWTPTLDDGCILPGAWRWRATPLRTDSCTAQPTARAHSSEHRRRTTVRQ